MDQMSLLPPMTSGENAKELEEQVARFEEYAKAKRNWENAFQKWSNESSQDGSNSYGCSRIASVLEWREVEKSETSKSIMKS